MKRINLSFFVLLFLLPPLFSQPRGRQVSYAMLANRAAAPVFHFSELQLPGESDDKTQVIFIFRFNNDFVPFKKISFTDEIEAPKEAEYFSIVRLNTEVFTGLVRKGGDEGYSSTSRDVWQDTLFTSSYEDTQSRELYNSGYLKTELPPGQYNYLLQLSFMGETNDRNSRRQNLKVKNFATSKTGEVYLLKPATNNSDPLDLLNLGDKVFYGKDYRVLVRIPEFNHSDRYRLEIEKIRANRDDTTSVNITYASDIQAKDIHLNKTLVFKGEETPSLYMKDAEDTGYTYALLDIPNRRFENASFRINIYKEGDKKPVASKVIRSYWPDMPPALYSLDMALDMLKYIISDSELKELKKGSDKEKEAKFRSFWASKDPTPDTEYNELMTEYYRRIDYAFKEYSNPEHPLGQETDMGQIYIKFGPPLSKNRRFPEKGRAIETWTYPNQTFVFEKGSGFSQFELVGRQ